MRTRMTIAAAFLCAAGLARAAEADGPMTPIRAFVAAIDKNDMAGARAAHVDEPTIIDEFSPHHWSGKGALDAWGADFGKDAQAHGDTDAKLTIVKIGRLTVEGEHAYAVVPTDFSYKRKGKPVTEHGTITYALDKTAAGWRIAGWAYSW